MTLIAGVLTGSAQASTPATKINKKIESYSVGLGATRVIYNPASSGAVLSVNNPNDYPMLVQSKVFAEDKKTAAPFVVTPPLFRLDGHQQSRVRIVQTGGEFPGDRESLRWLCVTGIPPESDDAWAKGADGKKPAAKEATIDVKIKFTRCIKVLVRPGAVKANLLDEAGAVTWKRQGKALQANNPTPFYINLKTLRVGGKEIKEPDYIAPFSAHTFALPKGAAGQVEWTLVTDQGGESRPYTAALQ
ncbi:TPA: fimbria/pilus periplasmic chaperone [Serratia marcescens]|uniref:fimbria/pilus periplasmic chaperone n=1 Tax=Serratia marcescens TaxID=615 RepID=UPI00301BB6F9